MPPSDLTGAGKAPRLRPIPSSDDGGGQAGGRRDPAQSPARVSAQGAQSMRIDRVRASGPLPCQAFFLFAAAWLSCPPNASAAPASLSASPITIQSGDTVTVSGSGFAANASIALWLDTNADGNLDL